MKSGDNGICSSLHPDGPGKVISKSFSIFFKAVSLLNTPFDFDIELSKNKGINIVKRNLVALLELKCIAGLSGCLVGFTGVGPLRKPYLLYNR